MPKKSPEQKAEKERRYVLACGASNTEDRTIFNWPKSSDSSHGSYESRCRCWNLDRFANDKFWGVRMGVVHHANISEATLRRLLEAKVSKRGVVHHAAQAKLLELGIEFGEDGMPLDMRK